jgi:HPt (histidine-containing phosphotransfer) domain-containing protein
MTDGLDVKQGLRHCNNDPAIYTAVLQQFLLQYREGINTTAWLTNTEQAKIELHTLKGLCATIGALPLSSLAAHSYQHWDELTNTQAKDELQQLTLQLQTVMQTIDNYLNTQH